MSPVSRRWSLSCVTSASPDAPARHDCRGAVPTPHGLRRSAATMLARQGVHVNVAAKQLGRTVETMLRFYVTLGIDVQAVAADAIDAALAVEESRESTRSGA